MTRHARRAFTLVEVLVAIALLAVVLAAVGGLTIQVVRLGSAVEYDLARRTCEDLPWSRIRQDLDSRIDERRQVTLTYDTHARPQIEMVGLCRVDAGHSRRLPCRIQYRVVREPGDDTVCLVRDTKLLNASAKKGRQWLMCALDQFRIEVLSEEQWQALPVTPPKQPYQAIRIAFITDGKARVDQRTYLLRDPWVHQK